MSEKPSSSNPGETGQSPPAGAPPDNNKQRHDDGNVKPQPYSREQIERNVPPDPDPDDPVSP